MGVADAYVDLHIDGQRIAGEIRSTLRAAGSLADKDATVMGRRLSTTLAKTILTGPFKTIAPTFKTIGIASAGIVGAGAIPQVLSLAGSLTNLVGVAGLAPAAIGVLGASVATLTVGLKGLGEAFKYMSGDPKKFAKAMENLAPAARQVVMAVKGVAPEFKNMRLQVQQALLQGVGKDITTIANAYLPVLTTGLKRVAIEANSSFLVVRDMLTSGEMKAAVADIFKTSAGAVGPLTTALANVIPAFAKIAQVGTQFIGPLAGGIAKASETFKAFIDRVAASGALKDWIATGMAAFGQLWSVLKSVVTILFDVISAAQEAGGGTLATFAAMLKRVADVTSSRPFQEGLVAFFGGVMRGAEGVMTALPAIGNLFAALGPVIGNLAMTLGPILGRALTVAANLLTQILPVISNLIEQIGPLLVPIVIQLSRAFLSLAPVVTAIVSQLGPILIPILSTLTSAFVSLMPSILTIVNLLGPVLGTVIKALAPIVLTLVAAIAPLVVMLVRALAPVIIALTPAIASVAAIFVLLVKAIQPLLDVLLPILIPVIQFLAKLLLNALGSAINGVINIVEGLTKVFQGVIDFVKNVFTGNWSGAWEAVKNIFSGIWQALVGAFEVWLNSGIFGVLKGVLGGLKTFWKAAWEWVKGLVVGVFTSIISFFSTTWYSLVTLFGNRTTSIKSVVGAAFNWIKDKISAVWDGIKALLRIGWDWIKKIVFDPMKVGLDGVGKAFDATKKFIGKVWDGLKAIAKAPIKFIIETVLNNGLIGGFNWLSSKIGGPQISKIPLPPGFAGGGVLPGWSPGKDIHRFYSPTGGFLNLSGGEAIMRPEFTRMIGGPKGVAAWNKAAMKGSFASGGVWGGPSHSYAGGGIIDWIKSKASDAWGWVTDKASALYKAVTNPMQFLKDRIAGMIPGGGKMLMQLGSAAVTKVAQAITGKVGDLWNTFTGAFRKVGLERTALQGVSLDGDTARRVLAAIRTSGIGAHLIQGSWSHNPLSKGTHAGAGAFDLIPRDGMWLSMVSALRNQGLLAMFRNWSGNQHIHGINPFAPGLSPQALAQVARARANNGIFAGGGVVSFDRGGMLQPGFTIAHNGTGRPEPVGHDLGGTTVMIENITLSLDDLAKIKTIEEFIDMLLKARATSRGTARSGSTTS